MSEIALLREAVLALDGPVFAVLDGAQFADLPDALLRAGLRHRPLYLDRGDNHPERLVTAPQMLGPLGGETLDKTLALLDEASPAAAVFWQCPAGDDSLYRHLRGINMVRIPKPSVDASRDDERDPARPKQEDEDDTHETVLFRHADANVMAQIAPALETPQLARLLGPADALFFLPGPDWQDPAAKAPVRILRKHASWPKAQAGLLTIDLDQYDMMQRSRLEQSRRTIGTYLRSCAIEETEGLSDDELRQEIITAERSGKALGLRSEAAHGQWAFLMLTTGGEISRGEMVQRAVGRSRDPDAAMSALMREMVRLSKSEGEPSTRGRA